jgi:anti-sigma regulatory factor (Ser/Thr protein kinase)
MEMITFTHRLVPIATSDSSQIGNARRQAISIAGSLGFDDTRQGQVGIIVTEIARNIAVHAGTGELVLCPWSLDGAVGVDIFGLDRGKGIPNIEKALEDGYSTAGTAGQGLGAISRLANEFQIYSTSSLGTALFARILQSSDIRRTPQSLCFGAVSLPLMGESASGDAWSSSHSPERSIYIVADGLGHGPMAAEAAEEAIKVFHQTSDWSPERILKDVHAALAKTRGAAVSIAEIRYRERVLNYAGAGNIAAAIWSKGKSRSMVSMNGTVGHAISRIQSFAYPWEPNSLLMMHSDGVGTRWNMEQYPGLAQRHPALVAAVLFRDFSRKRDDATIVVSRIQAE